ncbi:MAG: hypothetical protein HKM93_02955 [Desulfobacteraceae bacterium]|nr:hypothetical protein [Desulfobacteraceae bacterium]
MDAIRADYDKETEAISVDRQSRVEDWLAVCERYNDDVHRLCDVDQDDYTALYACYDEDNKPFYYLVKETKDLARLKRKIFLQKLGMD